MNLYIPVRGIFLYQNVFTMSVEGSNELQQCGFRTGPTQTDLYSHRKELEA